MTITKKNLNPSPPPLSLPLQANTTEQEDLVTYRQNRISLVWEITQSFVAIIVVGANMAAALWNVFHGIAVDVLMILSSSLFLILGFYFARTNHAAIGGTGPKATDNQEYKGR